MDEHRPESVPQSPERVEGLRRVTLPAIPTVYGLEDPDDGVTAWVFALPGGLAYIVSSDEEKGSGVAHLSLDDVVRFWAPFHEAELVLVTAGCQPEGPQNCRCSPASCDHESWVGSRR
ncbi:MAG: hypothetical protein ACRDR6_24685 [Pseudonocardiaceae bacterium]